MPYGVPQVMKIIYELSMNNEENTNNEIIICIKKFNKINWILIAYKIAHLPL